MVISSISCLTFVSGILVEVLETKLRRLILEVAPQGSLTQNHIRSNFITNITSLKRHSAVFVAFADIAASVASHPDISETRRRSFAFAGIMLAAIGCALYIVSGLTSLLVTDGIVDDVAKDANMPVDLNAFSSRSSTLSPD
ncbi:hypothetical protein BT69DRAFT_1284421 [Atractiella rhizophila]|nr:hypothetical protein BT69DRAFT_1284421 [Atractiella rhizophila]